MSRKTKYSYAGQPDLFRLVCGHYVLSKTDTFSRPPVVSKPVVSKPKNPIRNKQRAVTLDAYAKEMVSCDYLTDEDGQIIPGSEKVRWKEDEDSEESSEDWDSPIKPLKKLPKCEACKVCGSGVRHFSRCHICPHKDSIASYKTYKDSPCSSCKVPNDSRKNGHNKVWTFDESLHGGMYQPPSEIVSDQNYETILDCLRGFASLEPQEFSAYIKVHYFTKTLKQAGKEMETIFFGSFGKNKVMALLKSAESKLSEVSGASKILRGKILGQE